MSATDDDNRTPLHVAALSGRSDVVVFGSVHRGMPLYGEVLAAYPPERIIFLDGEDEHGWLDQVDRFASRGTYFMRELPDGCPAGMAEVVSGA